MHTGEKLAAGIVDKRNTTEINDDPFLPGSVAQRAPRLFSLRDPFVRKFPLQLESRSLFVVLNAVLAGGT